MAETMKLQVITPDQEFYSGEASMVELNTADGQLGIYPMHVPLTVAVLPGVLSIHEGSEVKKAALLSGGACQKTALKLIRYGPKPP